jgi:hypothetical protein
MSESSWNPWKITAIGMALVLATALVTGIVVAKWGGQSEPTAQAPAPSAMPRAAQSTAPRASAPVAAPAPQVPSQSVVDACNQYAANQAGQQNKTMEVVKDAAIGAVVGAAVGAAGGAIADGGKGAGKGAAIGGVVGAGGGTLYGLNENKKHDEQYRAAYGSCLRSRGYAG